MAAFLAISLTSISVMYVVAKCAVVFALATTSLNSLGLRMLVNEFYEMPLALAMEVILFLLFMMYSTITFTLS